MVTNVATNAAACCKCHRLVDHCQEQTLTAIYRINVFSQFVKNLPWSPLLILLIRTIHWFVLCMGVYGTIRRSFLLSAVIGAVENATTANPCRSAVQIRTENLFLSFTINCQSSLVRGGLFLAC